MVRNSKNWLPAVYLTLILLIVNSLYGCSGCSKSGHRKSISRDKSVLINKVSDIPDSTGSSIEELDIKYDTLNLTSYGTNISGRVISVIDGDTYDLLVGGNKAIRIRMEGIDAPESGMPFYRVSKNYLGQLCFNQNVNVHINGKDRHNRYICFTYLEDGTELSHEMIKAGLAWHYKEFNSDEDLSNLEIEARTAKKGLWSDREPMPPWVNRKLHKQGISTKDHFNSEVNQ